MGWLGRKSINTALTVFDEFVESPSYNSDVLNHTLTTQMKALETSLPYIKADSFINTIEEELYSYAAVIRKPDAKKMAANTMNTGIRLKEMTGDDNIYYGYLLMGSYFQCIAETNSLKSNINSRKYLISAGLMSKVIEKITSVLRKHNAH